MAPENKPIVFLPQQKDVFKWVVDGNGSLRLIARAGCGKTFTLIECIKLIIKHGLGDVAIMAFNKSIADELKAKLGSLGIDWRQAEANTVHAFGFRAWRKIAPTVQLLDGKVLDIIDRLFAAPNGDPHPHRNLINKMVGYAKQRAFGHLIEVTDRQAWMDVWNHFDLDSEADDGVDVEDIIDKSIKTLRESFALDHDVIDFNDMILAPLVHKVKFWPKKWVMIDESQDTNPARRALALKMVDGKSGRVIFVGDDRQAIYGFAGADSNAMDQLAEATRAKTLPLTVTMRCPKAVVKMAQSIVPDITAHENAPEGKVSSLDSYESLLKLSDLSATDAIICRNNAPLVETAFALIARGVACRIEGRDIGEGLVKLAQRWKVKDLSKLLDKLDDYFQKQSKKYIERKQEYLIDRLSDQLNCMRILVTNCTSQGKHAIRDLVELIQSMFGDSQTAKKQVLVLSSIHKAKGREWPRVFMLGRNEFLPSPYAKLEWQQIQESNLEYVMITRAQQELIDVPAPPKKKEK